MNLSSEDNKPHWALPILIAGGTALVTGVINWFIEEMKDRRKKKLNNSKENR